MKIKYIPYERVNPWVVFWKSSWTGKRHKRAFPSEVAANDFLKALEDIFEQEKRVMAQRRKRLRFKKQKITVEELFSRYFSLALTNKTTIKQSQYHASHLIKMFGKRQVSLLTNDDIMNFVEVQKIRKLNPTTINRRISIFRTAVNWAVKNSILHKNPFSGLKLAQAHSRRFLPPTPFETKCIYNAAVPHLQRVIAIGTHGGPRIGPSELFQLRWSDINLEAAIMHMPNADKGATERSREIPIKRSLLPLLREWREADLAKGISFVISWRGNPVRSVNRAWHTAIRKAGIGRRITPYSLRHSFATYAIEGGAKLKAVAKLMGHRDETMLLQTYQHVLDTQEFEAIEAVPDILNLESTRSPKVKKRRVASMAKVIPPHGIHSGGILGGFGRFISPCLLKALTLWISPRFSNTFPEAGVAAL